MQNTEDAATRALNTFAVSALPLTRESHDSARLSMASTLYDNVDTLMLSAPLSLRKLHNERYRRALHPQFLVRTPDQYYDELLEFKQVSEDSSLQEDLSPSELLTVLTLASTLAIFVNALRGIEIAAALRLDLR